ncbi:hypothetical protein ACQ4PT_005269 [Festuca glaucescens]
MDTTHQSLVAQLNLIAFAVQEGAKANADAVRHLAALDQRVNNTSQALERIQYPSPEEDDPDPVDSMVAGKGALHTTAAAWTGNAQGASTAAHKLGSPHAGMEGNMTQGGGGLGGACGSVLGGVGGGGQGGTCGSVLGGVGGGGLGGTGGSVLGGVGGGGLGGAGGGRPGAISDPYARHNLKMSFPRFDGENPRIWKDKCLGYFRLFNVNPSLWLVSATLHMDGNAALWLKAYRLRHEISTWPALMAAVLDKFGADDYRKYSKQMFCSQTERIGRRVPITVRSTLLPNLDPEPALRRAILCLAVHPWLEE